MHLNVFYDLRRTAPMMAAEMSIGIEEGALSEGPIKGDLPEFITRAGRRPKSGRVYSGQRLLESKTQPPRRRLWPRPCRGVPCRDGGGRFELASSAVFMLSRGMK